MVSFVEGFWGVFLAQCTVLFIAWLWKRFIEPRLDKTHKKVGKIIRKKKNGGARLNNWNDRDWSIFRKGIIFGCVFTVVTLVVMLIIIG